MLVARAEIYFRQTGGYEILDPSGCGLFAGGPVSVRNDPQRQASQSGTAHRRKQFIAGQCWLAAGENYSAETGGRRLVDGVVHKIVRQPRVVAGTADRSAVSTFRRALERRHYAKILFRGMDFESIHFVDSPDFA
jgi:hypothetical protein